MRSWGFFSPVCLYFQLVRGMADGLGPWIKILLTYVTLVSKWIFLHLCMVCKYIVFSKASTCAEGWYYSSAEGYKCYQGELYFLVATGSAYAAVYKFAAQGAQNRHWYREQQGGNWVEQTLRITQPNPSSLKSVKKPTSEKSELSPQRIRRSGSVQWNLHSFGTSVAVVHWLTWEQPLLWKKCYWCLSLDFSSMWLVFFLKGSLVFSSNSKLKTGISYKKPIYSSTPMAKKW